jgi:hypothetical protein
MPYIVLVAVIGILLLEWTDSIPRASVGGSLTIALAFFIGALVVGIHEAWTKRRGVLGWIVNIVVSFLGAFLAAQLGGMVMLVHGSAIAGGHGRDCDVCLARRRDALHGAGSVGGAADREPVAMSLLRGERLAVRRAKVSRLH